VKALEAGEVNWLVDAPGAPLHCTVQWRVHGTPEPATVQVLEGGRFRVDFHAPVVAVATGQAAVLYDGERVLGGGWIDCTERSA
jgi:tRNA-specific 2-thiouridylase